MKPVAIVTGASRGIGRGIVVALAKAGYDCVVNYAKNAAAADEVVKEIESAGGRALALQADVSLAADREKLVAEAVKQFGRIDLLVNNAGVAPDVRADLLDATEASFDRLININLKGPYFLTQLVARQMIGQKKGDATLSSPKVVTVSSISAYTASVNRGDYCVAKAGLSMMNRLFALRLARHGISCHEIQPGLIDTDMIAPAHAAYSERIENGLTPIQRWGLPADIGRAVTALATQTMPFTTGHAFQIDGGLQLSRL
jgi:NAD(P)-dependent dehydrogenase (short-subunit alcohol dehydrogenase family)